MGRRAKNEEELPSLVQEGRKIRSEGRYLGRARCPHCGRHYAHLWATDEAAWLECDDHTPQLWLVSRSAFMRRAMVRLLLAPAPL